ncbi:hypothetical protein [Sorangium sp. So ce1099]|uniref:hypothetical protein n=1 Tax=Sorangium sp. So ce1099 TaxID=3133331 RepID=UPI003F63F915
MQFNRRRRATAEHWCADTDKMKDHAPFPVSRGAASTGGEAEGEAGAGDDGAPDARLAAGAHPGTSSLFGGALGC